MQFNGVTISDLALSIQCLCLAVLLGLHPKTKGKIWFLLIYASLCLASLAGAVTHGCFDKVGTSGHTVSWAISLLSVGACGLALFNLCWHFGGSSESRRNLAAKISLGAYFVYSIYILSGTRPFLSAILFYLPSTLALLVISAYRWRREPQTKARYGFIGLSLSLLAAVIQQTKLSMVPVYFDHNTLYHLVQAVGLFFIFAWFEADLKANHQA